MSTDIVRSGGSLAIRADQTEWDDRQAAVLRQSGINNDVTGAELSAFLHLCQRTKLDPFSRQIYLIGRWNGKQQRQVYTPQTSIDGYRVIAHRAAAEAGHALGYDDTLWCAKDGRWRDVWLSDEPPAAAKVTVIRNGQRFSAVARYSEYVQTGKEGKLTGLWGKMPATMTAKCAEALALRMAFPHDLAGVYTSEEMGQADNPSQERHLRPVRPGDPDQWATGEPQTAAQGRDYLHEAHEAATTEDVRRIWKEAQDDGAVPEYLAQIAAVGREKAAAEQPPAPTTSDDGVVDAEVVPDSDEHAAAVTDLRAFAAANGLNDIDNDAYAALGVPLADASPAAIRDFLNQLRGTAA